MPVRFVRGDLFADTTLRAFAQGCNCAGSMNAGIALAFQTRWPRMVDEYAARCRDGRFALGDVFVWNEGDVTVYNLATQEHWRKKSQIAALTKATERMIDLAQKSGVDAIGMPRVGAGLGGLEWRRVRDVLSSAGERSPVTLVVFEDYVPHDTGG